MELSKEIAESLGEFSEKFLENMADDMRVLISSEVKASSQQVSLLMGLEDILPVFESDWVHVLMRDDGADSGNVHLLFDVRSAIALSALLMMMGGSSLPDMIKEKAYSEDLQEAFGEIANVLMGVMNTVVGQRIEGAHLHLESTAHLGGGEMPETLDGDMYVDILANVAVADYDAEAVHVLVSKEFAEALIGADLVSADDASATDVASGAVPANASMTPEAIKVKLEQLMTEPASYVNEIESVSKAIAVMEKDGVRQIGVVRDGVLIRVISWGDLRQLMGPFYGTNAMSARDKAVLGVQLGRICKTQKLVSISMTGSPAQALDLMVGNELKALPVVDQVGGLRGFIPAWELLKLLRGRLH